MKRCGTKLLHKYRRNGEKVGGNKGVLQIVCTCAAVGIKLTVWLGEMMVTCWIADSRCTDRGDRTDSGTVCADRYWTKGSTSVRRTGGSD